MWGGGAIVFFRWCTRVSVRTATVSFQDPLPAAKPSHLLRLAWMLSRRRPSRGTASTSVYDPEELWRQRSFPARIASSQFDIFSSSSSSSSEKSNLGHAWVSVDAKLSAKHLAVKETLLSHGIDASTKEGLRPLGKIRLASGGNRTQVPAETSVCPQSAKLRKQVSSQLS